MDEPEPLYRTAAVRIREKFKGTGRLPLAALKECCMFRECYRTATVRETVPSPIFSQTLRLRESVH